MSELPARGDIFIFLSKGCARWADSVSLSQSLALSLSLSPPSSILLAVQTIRRVEGGFDKWLKRFPHMCEGTAHSTSDQSALDAALGIVDAASGSTGAAIGSSKSDARCHASPALSHVAWMDDKRLGEDSDDEGGKKLSVHPSWLLQDDRDKEPGWREEIACDQDSMDEEDETSSIQSAFVGLCDELGSEVVAKWSWKTLRGTHERRLNKGEGDLDEWKKEDAGMVRSLA